MKEHVEIGHLTKYDAFRMNRDQVMDLEIWFKIHTNVSNFETTSPKMIYCDYTHTETFNVKSLLRMSQSAMSRAIQCILISINYSYVTSQN